MLFPVATLWGTFMHASGPLLVALGVVAALGGDALLARISRMRRWEKPNVVIAPITLVATAGLLTVFQVQVHSDQSRDTEARYATLAASVAEAADGAGISVPHAVITDHPVWLADTLDRYAVALPDEDLDSILELSEVFETSWVIVVGERGRYPEALLHESARDCLSADPLSLETGEEPAWLFRLGDQCETA